MLLHQSARRDNRVVRESVIQKQILTWLREQGCYALNIHGGPMQEAGIPDILFCCGGNFGGIEVKQPGQKASQIQLYHLNQIGAAGGFSVIAYSLKGVQQAMSDLDMFSKEEDRNGK